MKVLVTGGDGYLGWPLIMRLSARGHEVRGVDNFSKREHLKKQGKISAVPIRQILQRVGAWEAVSGKKVEFIQGDLRQPQVVNKIVSDFEPDAIVHLGENPSAPFSMKDEDHANNVIINNVCGTNNLMWAMRKYAPHSHLVKLGTMGEYGTPDCPIPEAPCSEFPRSPGSIYHCTKVMDSVLIEHLCKMWYLRSTDIMQGVVHGIQTKEMENDVLTTGFYFDGMWGTALNRFCAEAIIGHPLTVYGSGEQTRGYLALRDSIQCMTLAVENPPDEGEYRVFNQYDECYSINQLAMIVENEADKLGYETYPGTYENPRIEKEKHRYDPISTKLKKLGFKPTMSIEEELRVTLSELRKYKHRIKSKRETILPQVKWR